MRLRTLLRVLFGLATVGIGVPANLLATPHHRLPQLNPQDEPNP